MDSGNKVKSQERLKSYIQHNSISSVMSRTKWNKLFDSLKPIHGQLNFRRKDLRRSWVDGRKWNSDFFECFGLDEEIEWLEIKTTGDFQIDSKILLNRIKSAGVPCEATSHGFRIWGYLRPGVNPDWV